MKASSFIYTFRLPNALLCGEHKEAKIYADSKAAKGSFDDDGECVCECATAEAAAGRLNEICSDVSPLLSNWSRMELLGKPS